MECEPRCPPCLLLSGQSHSTLTSPRGSRPWAWRPREGFGDTAASTPLRMSMVPSEGREGKEETGRAACRKASDPAGCTDGCLPLLGEGGGQRGHQGERGLPGATSAGKQEVL